MSHPGMVLAALGFIALQGSEGVSQTPSSHPDQGASKAVRHAAPDATAELPTSLELTAVRRIVVQHDGRWMPLDTLARDIVHNVTGDALFQNRDPVLWLLAWTFSPEHWQNEPLIPIRNAELRRELELSPIRTVFSYQELLRHQHLRSLISALASVDEGRKLDPLEAKVSDISGMLTTLQRVFNGRVIRCVPHPTDAAGTWASTAELSEGESDGTRSVADSWASLRTAFLADDASAFAGASTDLYQALGKLPAGYRPTRELIATELRYNALRPFRAAWMVMAVGAVLAALALFIRRGWCDILALLGLVGGFATLSYGLWMRWTIAGRVPASNMFESLLFLSWGMGAFAIVAMIILRQRVVPLTASAMAAAALVLADCLPVDYFIRPIPPVLNNTIWMSIHVPVIMVSYSVLALGVLFAHIQLLTLALVPRREAGRTGMPAVGPTPSWRRAAELIDSLHYWYIHVGSILLLAGIITGSMWAASSWGRYWGWDPKEVWSLVAFLGYLTILHVRIDRESVPLAAYVIGGLLSVGLFIFVVPKLAPLGPGSVLALAGAGVGMAVMVLARGPFATAVKSIICFWLIIMTYVGVNYVLGTGLHSYGFGTGAMARYMLLIGGSDLGLVAVLTVVYLMREGLWRRTYSRAASVGASG
ncbi:MAG: cytochrome c biogenesis protein [Phycisphaerae bacterium]